MRWVAIRMEGGKYCGFEFFEELIGGREESDCFGDLNDIDIQSKR